MIYIARNLWWQFSHWNNKQFRKWIDDFNPDCVFFASGDYAFMYNIARRIAISRDIPLYVSCMDDYYFFNMNEDSLLGKIQHKAFMNVVKKTMGYATSIFCICDKMSKDYSIYFNKRSLTICTPSSISLSKINSKKLQISYLGGLGLGRYKQLIKIGKAIRELNLQINHIDVYSSESKKEIIDDMCEENGIIFHGAVGAEEVERIIKESFAVIHTESFDKKIRQRVKYSVSTKIADSLASGTCIFAYGPEEVASISYLKENGAAICCTELEDLNVQLTRLINDSEIRNQVIENALNLAKKNHLPAYTPKIIRNEILSYDVDLKEKQ